jgi:hypothetical protein
VVAGYELSILAVENRMVIELFMYVVFKELSDSVITHYKYNSEHAGHNNHGQSVWKSKPSKCTINFLINLLLF